MKIFVKVKVGSREEKVDKVDKDHFIVSVKEIPEKGKANRALISILSDYFKISPLKIRIISGLRSRQKIVEIGEKA
ncbi:MAG: DUF167 domain-containing protein [Candidatus Pacebacteria bacterium]|nr:DUF167 domain-containing protein [Candidatus Paceibacterota bacterium]